MFRKNKTKQQKEHIWKVPMFAAIIIAILTISTIPSIATVNAASVTFVVALDGSGNYRDIQTAINAVPANTQGTIIVKAGLYDLNPQYTYPYHIITLKS